MTYAQTTNDDLTQALFADFSDLVYRHSGIRLHEGKESLVRARLQKRLRALEMDSFAKYLEFLKDAAGPNEMVLLLDAISTNVTSFYRENDHFDYLKRVLTESKQAGAQRWRIWSAAASTGEEPYTIAMTACDALGGEHVDLKILGTDISTRALELARAGSYSQDKVRSIPADVRERWMERRTQDGQPVYAVREPLKKIVAYRRLNLSQPPFPMKGPFDVIFCRNVMIYFDDVVRRRLVDHMSRLLRRGGHLLIGHAESLTGISGDLRCLKPSVYVKP